MSIWFNEPEIDQHVRRFASHPILGRATRLLSEYRHEVNNNSDGWAYWKIAARAASKLMTLIEKANLQGFHYNPSYVEPTEADLRTAITPIKTFCTKHNLTMPIIS